MVGCVHGCGGLIVYRIGGQTGRSERAKMLSDQTEAPGYCAGEQKLKPTAVFTLKPSEMITNVINIAAST